MQIARRATFTRSLAAAGFILCGLGSAGAAQAGLVTVTFEEPAQFTDADRGVRAEQVQRTLAQHLEALGQARLPAEQTLQIRITDIDLAGEVPIAWRGLSDARVLRGQADWPRIRLSYTLSDSGTAVRSGSADLADLGYLQHPPRGKAADESLPYERRLLTHWFDNTFDRAP